MKNSELSDINWKIALNVNNTNKTNYIIYFILKSKKKWMKNSKLSDINR